METKNTLKQYLEQAPYGVLVVDKACNIVSSNREAQFITGVRDPEHRALTLHDLIVEQDIEQACACFNQLEDRNYASTIVPFGKRLKNPRTVSMKMVRITEDRHVIFTNRHYAAKREIA
ncbi:MAG: PAS domain S-box protein [Salinivirgaceae bacterium]|nr:PAS domain S-box protein [Salinivirgaceae bacterium]